MRQTTNSALVPGAHGAAGRWPTTMKPKAMNTSAANIIANHVSTPDSSNC
ncbi:MAG: hypothetical protein V4649_12585 [Bacteroidota bacterium]